MPTPTQPEYKYHYGVLRYIPDIVRDESVNVMLVLWLPEKARVLAARTSIERLSQAAVFLRIENEIMQSLVPSLEHLRDAANNMTPHPKENILRTRQFEGILTSLLPHDSSALQWSHQLSGGYDSLPEDELLHRLVARYL